MSEANNKKPLRGVVTALGEGSKGFVSYVLPTDETIDQVLSQKANQELLEDRFGTGGQHVARDLAGKVGYKDLDAKGPDPYANSYEPDAKKRDFFGDEFQGMLVHDKSGRPAFWSHFKRADGSPIQSQEDLKGQTFKIHLADKLPKYLEGHASIEGMDIWEGKPAKDAAVKVAGRLQKEIAEYAKEFSKVTGLNVVLTDDPKEADLTVMSWAKSKPSFGGTLLGFASFPESVNTWASLNGLGNKPAFMFLNNEWTERKGTSDREVRNLFAHEFGHNMGWAHPHDLARLNHSQAETLGMTLMAYSQGQPQDFAGTEGAGMGAIDYTFRKWLPEAPALNTGEGKVYDLQKHLEQSFKNNAGTAEFQRTRLLHTAVIVDSGKGTELHGTKGNDFIDTNPGYASIINVPVEELSGAAVTANDNKALNAHVVSEDEPKEEAAAAPTPRAPYKPRPAQQKIVLSEGHIAKVKGITGDNVIIASESGDQVIEPGNGKNEVRFYYQNIGGHKTIHSEGKDTLVLSQSILLSHKGLKATEKDGTLVIGDGKESITLSGNKLESIRVIDTQGRVLEEKAVKDLSADQINEEVLKPAAAKIQRLASFRRAGVNFADTLTGERTAAAGNGLARG